MASLALPSRPVWRSLRAYPVLAASGLLMAACGGPAVGSADLEPVTLEADWTAIRGNQPEHAGVEELLAPFRERLEERTAEVVGTASGPLEKADPEGSLDNLVADAMLWAARSASSQQVHAAMNNDGGLRAPIGAGPISVAEIFELMPFENFMAILEFTGHQVDSLAQQIAATDGEPVSGLRFVIRDGRAVDILIDGSPLDRNARYRLVSADFLANGGGGWPQLWTPISREDLPILVRDAIEQYVREAGTVDPVLDGRIRFDGAPGGSRR